MKRKEIKFRHAGRGTMEGRQDGVIYRIYHPWNRPESEYTVGTHDTKDKGRAINTAGHKSFTYEGAVEFCQQIAAGEIDLEILQAEFDAENAAKEQRVIRKATEAAKEFRKHLEAAGISYKTLLELEALRGNLGDLAHNFLLAYERGEGWPRG